MKKYLFLVPFVYVPLFIIWPVYKIETRYYSTVLFLFWYPVLLMLAWNWKWISDRKMWRPFLQVNLYLAIVSVYFEFACLGMRIWYFSQEQHKLLDFPPIFGAPIEEFMFYFGATPFCLLLYITFYRIVNSHDFPLRKRTAARDIDFPAFSQFAWLLVGFVFLPISRFLHNQVKKKKVMSWTAVGLTTAVFWIALAFIEAYCVSKGHWVYDKTKTLYLVNIGVITGVPIEEFFQYYLLAPIFVALFFHLLEMRPSLALSPTQFTKEDPPLELQSRGFVS